MKNKYFSKRHGLSFTIVNVETESVFDYVKTIKATNGETLGYEVLRNICWFSKRYNKWITIKKGDKSDGATYASDINSFSWLFHDDVCNFGLFEDGSNVNNWQASRILSDILNIEGKYIRSKTWLISTWLFGGGKARENGMF